MRRSRLVLFMAALLVMAAATAGLCGPPVGAGGAERAGAPSGDSSALSGAQGAPGGDAGGQGAASGLTVAPGGGMGSSGGSGSGSPALLMSSVGNKSNWAWVNRATYTLPNANVKVRIFADAVNNTSKASGPYHQASSGGTAYGSGSGNGFTGADRRNGHDLDVSMKVGLYNLYAQFGYTPTGVYSKNISMGPMIGIQRYSDTHDVTDNTNSSLSSSGSHTANFGTLGAWGELDVSSLFGRANVGGKLKGSKLYLAAMGGKGKDWQSFNWEALLTILSVNKGTLFSSSRYGQYMPAIKTEIGYVAYYFNQSRKDHTSSTFLVPGALPNALDENTKVNFGCYVVRVSGTF